MQDYYVEIPDKTKPTSALFAFKPIESKEEWKRNGLSSEFKKYSRYTLDFVSQHAAEIVASQHLKKLMTAVEFRNAQDGVSIGNKYEKCAIFVQKAEFFDPSNWKLWKRRISKLLLKQVLHRSKMK